MAQPSTEPSSSEKARRLSEHMASKAHRGPHADSTLRLHLRDKLGDEKPLVRAMYDRTTKPKRRKKS